MRTGTYGKDNQQRRKEPPICFLLIPELFLSLCHLQSLGRHESVVTVVTSDSRSHKEYLLQPDSPIMERIWSHKIITCMFLNSD